jgi:hypothetical protein
MRGYDISKRSPALRTQACNRAEKNWKEALTYAEQIKEPWYACQAFACCGRFAPTAEGTRLLDRAFDEAQAGKDAFQRLAAAAWPLRALAELKQWDRTEREFDRVAAFVAQVEPPSSRAEACFLVYQAVAHVGNGVGIKALQWLLSALQPVGHWRQRRAVRDAVIQSVSISIISQPEALSLISDDRLRKKIRLRLDHGALLKPRDFFWSRTP